MKILIDNDSLIHMVWKLEAKKQDVNLKCFSSVSHFLEMNASEKFSYDVDIYIDSDLGDGIKGEVISKELFDMGFQNLYLVTGYPKDEIEKPSWIIDIFGKHPRF